MSDEPDDADFSLVVPFVCCASNGGTLDDHAFVAGVTFGQAATELRDHPPELSAWVYPEMVAQYDLLGMHAGYAVEAGNEMDGWVLITMTKPTA